jgi:hypothetical protein
VPALQARSPEFKYQSCQKKKKKKEGLKEKWRNVELQLETSSTARQPRTTRTVLKPPPTGSVTLGQHTIVMQNVVK